MKRAPSPRPAWIRTCRISHDSGNVIDFPVIDDLPSLLWVINLGCIDLNQWYAKCDDVDRPDYLHFDLDPGSATWDQVLDAARIVRDALETLKMPAVREDDRIEGHPRLRADRSRAPSERRLDVREGARAGAGGAASRALTSEYRVAKRPKGRVLVDYNQNAWGRTLASVYSVRPHAVCRCLDAGDLAGNRQGRPHRGLSPRQRARAVQEDGRPVQAAAPQDRTGRSATLFLSSVLDEGVLRVGHQHGDRQRVQHLPDEEPGSVGVLALRPQLALRSRHRGNARTAQRLWDDDARCLPALAAREARTSVHQLRRQPRNDHNRALARRSLARTPRRAPGTLTSTSSGT